MQLGNDNCSCREREREFGRRNVKKKRGRLRASRCFHNPWRVFSCWLVFWTTWWPKYLMLDSGTRAYAYVWWKDIKIIWASKNFSVLTHWWWWRELVVVMKGWCTRWSDKGQNCPVMERMGVTSQRSTERSLTDDLFFLSLHITKKVIVEVLAKMIPRGVFPLALDYCRK